MLAHNLNKVKPLRTSWNKGKKMSAEQRKKLSVAHLGLPSARKGVKLTPEARLKLSIAHKGQKPYIRTPEINNKIRLSKLGKPRPDMSGENNPLWKGGLTPVRAQIRASIRYGEWRREIFTRDDFTCVWCKKKGGQLNADHIIPFASIYQGIIKDYGSENLYENAMKCDLLWDISNGRTLCLECHKKTDTYLSGSRKKK